MAWLNLFPPYKTLPFVEWKGTASAVSKGFKSGMMWNVGSMCVVGSQEEGSQGWDLCRDV